MYIEKRSIFDIFKTKEQKQQMKYAAMMNGMVPVFSNFGTDVYASDIVQIAISRVAGEFGKLSPQHIRTDPETGLQQVVNDDINRLLKYGPNEIMSTSDFLEKLIYLKEKYNNAFVYPAYEKIPLGNGKYKRKYTGLYPLNPASEEFKEDETGSLWIEFQFANGYSYTMPYADIIHLRKDYTENDFCGGNQSSRRSELNLLQADDIAVQGIGKGIKSSMGVKGILKINTLLDDDKQESERKAFEEKMKNSESGILPVDLKSDFISLKVDPKVMDKDTMEFIQTRILARYGVSIPIFIGKYTEEEYQAFYEATLEKEIVRFGREFSRKLFTSRELDTGNEIIFFNRGLMFTSTSNKIKVADILTRIGGLTDNEVLGIFGYPPFDGGDIRHQSLNFVNRDIADQYQLARNKGKENADGGKE